MTDARMSGAVAIGTNFSDATMRGCKIARANLSGANFAGANLENADLSMCELKSVNMRDTVLTNAALDLTKSKNPVLRGAMTDKPVGPTVAHLPQPLEHMMAKHSVWVTSDGGTGVQLDISGYDMRGIKIFARTCLSLMKANDATFYGVVFSGSQMHAANLRNADMRHVVAEHADMRGIDL